MTVDEIREEKRKLGVTNAMIAEGTDLPIGTVQKIFSGETRHPRYETLQRIEAYYHQMHATGMHATGMHATGMHASPLQTAAPDLDFTDFRIPVHLLIAGEVYRQMANHLLDQETGYLPVLYSEASTAGTDKHAAKPASVIICRQDQAERGQISGKPVFVLEVLPWGSGQEAFYARMSHYRNAGIQECWIIDPAQCTLAVDHQDTPGSPVWHDMRTPVSTPVSVGLFHGKLMIDFQRILGWIRDIPVSKRIGAAKGKFNVYGNFDEDNEAIANLLTGGIL